MTDSLDVDVSSEIRKEAQVGELVCHRANAKDRDERNMDMDMDIGVAGSPYSRNYGALTKRVAEY
jgi:hypothetical protein